MRYYYLVSQQTQPLVKVQILHNDFEISKKKVKKKFSDRHKFSTIVIR